MRVRRPRYIRTRSSRWPNLLQLLTLPASHATLRACSASLMWLKQWTLTYGSSGYGLEFRGQLCGLQQHETQSRGLVEMWAPLLLTRFLHVYAAISSMHASSACLGRCLRRTIKFTFKRLKQSHDIVEPCPLPTQAAKRKKIHSTRGLKSYSAKACSREEISWSAAACMASRRTSWGVVSGLHFNEPL